jgi:hypothetical protein
MIDMVTVSREEFLAYVGPLDIVLRSEPDCIEWETRGRHLVGRSFPGWRNHKAAKTYMLTRASARDVLSEFRPSTAPAVRAKASH